MTGSVMFCDLPSVQQCMAGNPRIANAQRDRPHEDGSSSCGKGCKSKGPKETHDAAVTAMLASASTAAENGTMHPNASKTTGATTRADLCIGAGVSQGRSQGSEASLREHL